MTQNKDIERPLKVTLREGPTKPAKQKDKPEKKVNDNVNEKASHTSKD